MSKDTTSWWNRVRSLFGKNSDTASPTAAIEEFEKRLEALKESFAEAINAIIKEKPSSPVQIDSKRKEQAFESLTSDVEADAHFDRLKGTTAQKTVKDFYAYKGKIGEADEYGVVKSVQFNEQIGHVNVDYVDGSTLHKFPSGRVERIHKDGRRELVAGPVIAKNKAPAWETSPQAKSLKEVETAIKNLNAAKTPGELRAFLAKDRYIDQKDLALLSDADLEEKRIELEKHLKNTEEKRREPFLQMARNQAEKYLQYFDPNFSVGLTTIEVIPDDSKQESRFVQCLRVSNLADPLMTWTVEIVASDEYLKNDLEASLKKSYIEKIESMSAKQEEMPGEEPLLLTPEMRKPDASAEKEEMKNDPRYKGLVEERSLAYLKAKDAAWFSKNFSGEVAPSGYLMDTKGKETNYLPSQNITAEFDRIQKEAEEAYLRGDATVWPTWVPKNEPPIPTAGTSEGHETSVKGERDTATEARIAAMGARVDAAIATDDALEADTPEARTARAKENPLAPESMSTIVDALKNSGKKKDGKFATPAGFRDALTEAGFKLPATVEAEDLKNLHDAYKKAAFGRKKA